MKSPNAGVGREEVQAVTSLKSFERALAEALAADSDHARGRRHHGSISNLSGQMRCSGNGNRDSLNTLCECWPCTLCVHARRARAHSGLLRRESAAAEAMRRRMRLTSRCSSHHASSRSTQFSLSSSLIAAASEAMRINHCELRSPCSIFDHNGCVPAAMLVLSRKAFSAVTTSISHPSRVAMLIFPRSRQYTPAASWTALQSRSDLVYCDDIADHRESGEQL